MKPTLLVLAAGMGSRYGGLKQLDHLGPHGETIMDYSVYDALQAGFDKIIFVIRHDFEEQFRQNVLARYCGHANVEVIFQEMNDLPDGYSCPPGRIRPWGTNHAILAGRKAVKGPFAVINADDFYGRDAFKAIANELMAHPGDDGRYCMVGFHVGNTMTRNGSVSRGVCSVSEGCLRKIVERSEIAYQEGGKIAYKAPNGHFVELQADTPVSMNLWGFGTDYFAKSEREFTRFLDKFIDQERREFFIPSVVDKLIGNGEASVKVLTTTSKWFGVTYATDRMDVMAKLQALHQSGLYPDSLF